MSGSIIAAEGDLEVTEEMRETHYKAFQAAVASLNTELTRELGTGQDIVVLRRFRNEFEEWEDGQIDGPMPPLATLERLQTQFRYVIVDKQVWKQSPDYMSKVRKIFDGHIRGGASRSYELSALFHRGIASIKSALRSGSRERALCEAILLTKAMADNDDWYSDTDVHEQVVKIVKALGNAWSRILSGALDERPRDSLLSWLFGIQEEWQGEASFFLGVKLVFAFEARQPRTPAKKRSSSELLVDSAELDSPLKKHKSEGRGQGKQASIEKADADTCAWLHRLDSELSARQASLVQLHCSARDSTQKCALVVSGSYPLRAVGSTLAEAFGKAVDDCDPHSNKENNGNTPAGLLFSLEKAGKPQKLPPTLKIVQAVQDAGDSLCMDMDGLSLNITLDCIKFKGDGQGQDVSEAT